MKSRGADAVFDYNNPNCAEQIRRYTNGSLRCVLDTISSESSYKICADALPEGDKEEIRLVGLIPLGDYQREDIKSQILLAYTTFGEAFSKFGQDFPPMPAHFEFGQMFWKLSARLLAEGKIKPHPVTMGEGGLLGIPAG